jgi:hypothetical protein
MVTQTPKNKMSSSDQVSQFYMLSARQLVIVIALGVFFWFVFALFIRFTGPLGIFGGVIGIVPLLANIPVAWLLTVIIKRMAGLVGGQIFAGMALSTAVAVICDGAALTWFPSLYGTDTSTVLLGAACILFGGGVITIVAYIMAAREINKVKSA